MYNAALNGHSATVNILCEHADTMNKASLVNALTVDGLSPLYAAAQSGHADCVEILLQSKTALKSTAELRLPDELGGHTALHVASQGGHATVVNILLNVGSVPVDPRTTESHTPLMLALYMAQKTAAAKYLQCAMALIRHGASLHVVDDAGRSALDWAPAEWRDDLHTFMLECGNGGGGGDEAGLLRRVRGKMSKEQRKELRCSSPADELDAASRDRRHLRSGGTDEKNVLEGLVQALHNCCHACVRAPCTPCRKLSSSTRFARP